MNKQNYMTSTKNSIEEFNEITFNNIITSVIKLNPNPIEEIKVGWGLYEDVLKKTKKLSRKKNLKTIGSLYGIKLKCDPDLLPNEYEIVQSTESKRRIAQSFGRLGGEATKARLGVEHFKRISKLGVEARRRK